MSEVLKSYTYLGLNTVVSATLPQENVEMSYRAGDVGINAPVNPNTEGVDARPSDPYSGLDRFGRIIDQNWFTIGGATLARDQYVYDADGNILSDNNLGPTSTLQAESELYGANGATASTAYDGLNRVTTFNVGTLSTSSGAERLNTITGGLASQPAWAMNSQGIYQRSDINAATNLPTFQGVYAAANMQSLMLANAAAPSVDAVNSAGGTVKVGSLSAQFDAWGDLTRLQQWTTTFTVISDGSVGEGAIPTELGGRKTRRSSFLLSVDV